ncbi:sunset domain-containing protein [Bacillus vallismortis]|uniref:sunset domain-containing protein n=1 Tax=Bacillus vallismortis TaxID=72361 RepID=UPI00209057CB|nr:hypothetical protein [Bacillus vallismortis]MCO4849618.1 hypothetical protein [Bacillus vallismortis]
MEMTLVLLGFLACLIALGYGMYHLFGYVLKKDQRFSKRVFWPLLIGGLALLFTGAGLSEPDEKYSTLNTEYQSLTKEHKALEKKYEEASSEAKTLKDNKKDQDKLQQLEKENNERKEKQKTLKAEIKELQENQKQLKENIKTAKDENKTLQQAKTQLEKQLKEAKNHTASSQETAGSSSSNTKNEAKTADPAEGCNIKGSKSGIYHIPGSTYYDRTTDPAEMFCSVEDAEAAGYRPPKR